MKESSDYNQATLVCLCVVIFLLYHLYKAQKRKLQHEEQKYIQKFLLRDDFTTYRPFSPRRGNLSPSRLRRGGESHSPKGVRPVGKVQSKPSPVKKSQTVIFERNSPPSGDKRSLSPASRVIDSKVDKDKILQWSPPERHHQKDPTSPPEPMKDSVRNFGFTNPIVQKPIGHKTVQIAQSSDSKLFQGAEERRLHTLGVKTLLKDMDNAIPFDSPPVQKSDQPSIRVLPVPGSFGQKIAFPKDEENESSSPVIVKDTQQEETKENADKLRDIQDKTMKSISVLKKKRGICFSESENSANRVSLKELESPIKKQPKQFETILDSSFESDSEPEEPTGIDSIPLDKKQLLAKSKIDLAYLSKYGTSTSLKRYVAKKIVQERMREKPSAKSMDEFFRSSQARNVTAASKTAGLNQSSQGSSTQGGLFGNTTSALKPNETSTKPSSGTGLFSGATLTNKPSENTAQSSLLGNAGKQNMFSTDNKNSSNTASSTPNQLKEIKTGGGGLFGNTTNTNAPQTGGLFGGVKTTTTALTSNPVAATSSQTLFSSQTTQGVGNSSNGQAKPLLTGSSSTSGGLFGNISGGSKAGENDVNQAQKPQNRPSVQTGGLFAKSNNVANTGSNVSTPLFASKT